MTAVTISKELQEKLRASIPVSLATKNIMAYRLAMVLIMIGEGHSVNEITNLFMVNSKTIFSWICKFMSNGIAWVTGRHYEGRGRKEKLTNAQKKSLYDMIVKGPEAQGFSSGIWNSAMIGELIFIKFSVRFNLNYLPSLLKKMKLSYQRARFISDRRDEEKYEQARKEWVEKTLPDLIKKAKEENAVVLFGDEVSFAMWGSLSRTWSPVGVQPTVKTKGIRKGLKMFGVIELKGGSFQYQQLLAYSLQAKSLKLLKEAGLPTELLAQIKTLKGNEYETAHELIAALRAITDESSITKYQEVILKHAETSGKFSGVTYIEFLKHLLANYSGKIFLIEDGAPYHHSKVVTEFKVANKDRLMISTLPAYSPDFNPIEKLWKNTKCDATHLKYFKTFEELHDSVVKAFKSISLHTSPYCVMLRIL